MRMPEEAQGLEEILEDDIRITGEVWIEVKEETGGEINEIVIVHHLHQRTQEIASPLDILGQGQDLLGLGSEKWM